MSTPDWKHVLPTPPAGGRLQEAWMTSFEQPDAGLLVEHLLPSLLDTSHSLSQDIHERTLFFGELGMALEALRGKITVISTPPRGERDDTQYPWLWRYVGHFTVGATSRAVQHAKLWAFRWQVGDAEFLELHVSSANLTTSAFKGQVQAGWRAVIQLGTRSTVSTRKSWGALAPFLQALGNSAGEIASPRIERLIALLGRVPCPPEVTFIASVPGGSSAARQLKQLEVSAIHLMTPTIGDWNNRTLASWSKDAGVAPQQVHLKWIAERHPWAESTGWALSPNAKDVLMTNGVQVECLPSDARLTKQHLDADTRWSHAKLYLLHSRKKRYLLVTSANWSASAWGAGMEPPRNFELGVVFESAWTDLERMGEPFDPPHTTPFCVERAVVDEVPCTLMWAEATWDGKRIELKARSSNADMRVDAAISFADRHTLRIALVDGCATASWTDPECTPLGVSFTQGADTLDVDVVDLRSFTEFAKTPLPEVDPDVAIALREAFLLQRYGGPAVDVDAISGIEGERGQGMAAPAADYSVQAWNDARAAFHVIDQWRAALGKAQNDLMLLERVRVDGDALRALFARREGPATSLACQEMSWRIEEDAE